MKALEYYELSHIGGREINQDYCAHRYFDNAACFIVADGLGGHTKGEVASSSLCEAFMEVAPKYYSTMLTDPVITLEKWITHAGETMRDFVLKNEGEIDTQTTFAFLWMDDTQVVTAHVGDSRIYRLSMHHPIWRTPDHTMLQVYLDEGKITEEEVLNHPLQNRLLKSVNIYESPAADIYVHPPLMEDETLILCTDGFWNYLHKRDLVRFAASHSLQISIEEKMNEILKINPLTADNITVLSIRFERR